MSPPLGETAVLGVISANQCAVTADAGVATVRQPAISAQVTISFRRRKLAPRVSEPDSLSCRGGPAIRATPRSESAKSRGSRARSETAQRRTADGAPGRDRLSIAALHRRAPHRWRRARCCPPEHRRPPMGSNRCPGPECPARGERMAVDTPTAPDAVERYPMRREAFGCGNVRVLEVAGDVDQSVGETERGGCREVVARIAPSRPRFIWPRLGCSVLRPAGGRGPVWSTRRRCQPRG